MKMSHGAASHRGRQNRRRAALIQRETASRHRCVFAVLALSLIDQTVERLYSSGIHDVGVIQADHPLTNCARGVQVASVQTLSRRQIPSLLAVQADIVGDLDDRVAQIDATVQADTSRGRTKSALAIVAEQSHARADLVVRRETAAEKLALLRVQRAAVARERRKIEADDLGPLRFLSALFGFGTEQTMRAFVLAVSLLLDLSAVLLLLAATTRRGAR